MEPLHLNILSITLAPESNWVFLALGIMVLDIFLLYCLSFARSGVTLLTESDLRKLHNKKNRREQRVYTFCQRKDKIKASISTMEILMSMIFVMLSFSLIKSNYNIFNEYFGTLDFHEDKFLQYAVAFVVITMILVITIEIPSRIYSDFQKNRFLLRTSWLVNLIYSFTSSITFADAYSQRGTEQETSQISVALDSEHAKMGEKEILRNILQFGDTEVKEIMTPRHNIVAIEKNEKFSTLKKTVVESNFSRIPVFEKTPDNIFGIIYVKDMLKYINREDDFDWTRLVRKITYVSENKKISDLLKAFQQKKMHMAAVSDEYGGISGLITMQDILEQIVGEINDEFDNNDEVMFKKITDTFYIFDGKIMLSDFYKAVNLEDTFFDDIKGDAESLAGVLLEMKGEFPALGEKISYKNLTFTIEAFNNRRIEKIGVKVYND